MADTAPYRAAADDWSARQYLKFEDERTRAPRDLLAQVPLTDPKRVVDLGCGPGNSTELLIKRFPNAEVLALDSSPDMLRQARERLPNGKFIHADLATWMPDAATDLLFGNAVFQWLPDHPAILARLLAALPDGGVLAVQMPDNTREPALTLMDTVASAGPWSAAIRKATGPRKDLLSPEQFYDLLRPLCSRLDVWHTHYYHVMPDHAAVVEWFKGSSLRPFYSAVEGVIREQFLAAYTAEIARAYPARHDGKVMLKFPRLFLVAVR
jgi:trans-aconitate 2-methyltransferase